MNRSFNKSQSLRYLECSAVEVKSKVRRARRGLDRRRPGAPLPDPLPSALPKMNGAPPRPAPLTVPRRLPARWCRSRA